jgi:hypothetical protein
MGNAIYFRDTRGHVEIVEVAELPFGALHVDRSLVLYERFTSHGVDLSGEIVLFDGESSQVVASFVHSPAVPPMTQFLVFRDGVAAWHAWDGSDDELWVATISACD